VTNDQAAPYTEARAEILRRIRAANQAATHLPDAEAAGRALPRDYRRASDKPRHEVLGLLVDRLLDYDAQVDVVQPEAIASSIERVLAARRNPRMLVPPGFPQDWLPSHIAITEDRNFSPAQLDGFEGVLTTASLAIAETGTLVLQNAAGQGRRAVTLVPDFHLCILRAEQVVHTVPEAFARLAGTSTLPTTFVSGPSATADIEMTRIKGVHGPRTLHVVLVDPFANS